MKLLEEIEGTIKRISLFDDYLSHHDMKNYLIVDITQKHRVTSMIIEDIESKGLLFKLIRKQKQLAEQELNQLMEKWIDGYKKTDSFKNSIQGVWNNGFELKGKWQGGENRG